MDESIRQRLRRAARSHADAPDGPSELRQALADLGRVIGEPVAADADRVPTWADAPP